MSTNIEISDSDRAHLQGSFAQIDEETRQKDLTAARGRKKDGEGNIVIGALIALFSAAVLGYAFYNRQDTHIRPDKEISKTVLQSAIQRQIDRQVSEKITSRYAQEAFNKADKVSQPVVQFTLPLEVNITQAKAESKTIQEDLHQSWQYVYGLLAAMASFTLLGGGVLAAKGVSHARRNNIIVRDLEARAPSAAPSP